MAEVMTIAGVEVSRLDADITITPRALAEIRRLRADHNLPADVGLRVGIKGGGCSGFTYALAFDNGPREGDRVLDKEDVRVFIDSRSLFYLAGTQLDFADGLNGRGFTFHNPNATHTCGCGNSFGV